MLNTERQILKESIDIICKELNTNTPDESKEEDFLKLVGQYDKPRSRRFKKSHKEKIKKAKKEKSILNKNRKILQSFQKNKNPEIVKMVSDQNIPELLKKAEKAIKDIDAKIKKSKRYCRAISFQKNNLWIYLSFAILSVFFLGWVNLSLDLSITWAISSTILFLAWKTINIVDSLQIISTTITRKIFLAIAKIRLPLVLLIPNVLIISKMIGGDKLSAIYLLVPVLFELICLLCDLFWQSDFFGDKEDTIVLVITAFWCSIVFIPLIPRSTIADFIVSVVLVVVCLLLTALCIKKCIFESHSFNDYLSIINFVIFLGSTIIITIYTLYRFFWNPDGESQTLFAAVMGVYAAILGGTITLGGVAWTIRKSDFDRKEKEIKSAVPYLQVFEKKSENDGIISQIVVDYFPGVKYIQETVFCLKCVSNSPCIFVGVKSQKKIIFVKKQILANGDICQVILKNFIKTDDSKIICEDSLGNYYSYDFDREKIEIGLPVPIKEEDLQ